MSTLPIPGGSVLFVFDILVFVQAGEAHSTAAPYCDTTAINDDRETPIKIRQSKYLNNLVEQDHRTIKRRTRPMLGFKTFRCARILLAGIELMHMIAKGQMTCARGTYPSAAVQFYELAT